MYFELDHVFAASVQAVEAAVFHPGYSDFMVARSKLISGVRIELCEDDGVYMRCRKHVTARSPVERLGPHKIDPNWCRFVEEMTWDRRTHIFYVEYIPQHQNVVNRLVNRGEIALEETAPCRTRRRMQCEVRVQDLPLLLRPFTGVIEEIVVREAKRALENEAETMRAWLAQLRPAGGEGS